MMKSLVVLIDTDPEEVSVSDVNVHYHYEGQVIRRSPAKPPFKVRAMRFLHLMIILSIGVVTVLKRRFRARIGN